MAGKMKVRNGIGLIAIIAAGALTLSAISITGGPAKRIPYERKVKFQTTGTTHKSVVIEWSIAGRGDQINTDNPVWTHSEVGRVGDALLLSVTQVTADQLTCMIIVDDEIIANKLVQTPGTCSVRALLPPA